MKNNKRINIKSLLLVSLIICMLILLFPSAVLAQEDKESLLLNFTSGYYNSEIKPGESKTIYLEVENKSTTSTTDIQFSFNAPDDWMVEFNPGSIEVIEAGNYEAVEVTVMAPANVEKGDYSITVIADSSAGRRVISTYFWVEKGTNIWIWVGGALGIVVIILFVFIYRRFTRE
ncbi:MAG: hypothetical protein JW967_09670 [Dehalococcoidales bacterium]|nr:hypothetical protein [Dehalococcoidales bacterium]